MQLTSRNHQSSETMKELRALNARFIHNFVTNDVPSHDAILHPGFINIWPSAVGPRNVSEVLGNCLRSPGHRLLGCPRRTHYHHRQRCACARHEQAHAPPRWK
jgi:hypothetical protein